MANLEQEAVDPVISIGTLAEKVGLSVSAVRKYETEGLIVAHRQPSGHRLFSHEDVYRVRIIQRLIQGGLNIEGIRRLQAMMPCWDLLPCTKKMRDRCPAYRDNSRPCWAIRGLECETQGNECRKCVVYRFGSMCVNDIKRVVHDPKGSKDLGAALQEVLANERRSKED